ncbi:MAG: hypothetical protein JRH11_20075 [Deltaproteobacteria bacterium]|nr:hypothetical protein [Deltaproteobacteria bacterium]
MLVSLFWVLASATVAAAQLATGDSGVGGGEIQRSEPRRSVDLAWVRMAGAESCPSSDTMRSAVTGVLRHDPFGTDPALRIEGVVTHLDPGWSAVLFLRDRDGEDIGTRDITSSAEECEALARAVVLAVAIAIDPRAGLDATADLVVLDVPPERTSADPADHQDDERVPALGGASHAQEPEGGDGPADRDPPVDSDPSNAPPNLTAAVEAVFGAGMVPASPVPGLALAVRGRLLSDYLTWGVGGFYFGSRDANALGLSLTAGWLEVCGALWPHRIVELRVCGRGAAGAYQVYVLPTDVMSSSPGQFGWGAVGAVIGAEIRIAGPLVATAELASLISLTTLAFARDDVVLFAESPVSLLAAVGLGVAF